MDSRGVKDLYAEVLQKEQRRYYVGESRIKAAIQNMKDAYLPDKDWEEKNVPLYVNYDDAAHRCAYLHKYAACYTGMVQELLKDTFQRDNQVKRQLNSLRKLNLCSLGGGPGTDVVAILDVFANFMDFIPCSVNIIDLNGSWRSVFESVVQELQCGNNRKLKNMLSPSYFRFNYITANMLLPLSPLVKSSIMSADFISMVKFISAAACDNTESMVSEIFRYLKPGALVMFIDNAAGGFLQMLQDQARNHRLQTVRGPVEHYRFENADYSVNRFGYTSQSKTTVSLQIWMKPQSIHSTSQSLRHQYVAQAQARQPRQYDYVRHGTGFRIAPEQERGCCSLN
ncbi:uncharacterized protein LOC129217321 [Uloborus diversus]|uniref:uncharacterized protein LOC129217321 n=1 Tax=Uloborus diversus TaxID=327109 RepID=UPI0024092116|nr:uncharacterized protein LOC129217321 [Uloborus diversus]